MSRRFQALRGTRDILPQEMPRWSFVERTARSIFERYQFQELRTPILEPTELFARSVGASSDIVRKEMYVLERGDESIALRPEATASVVRAFVEHALHRGVAEGYPERYFYIGPMFRHERPQRGRLRQFHQIGAELLGAEEPQADAETLEMLERFLDELGLDERELVLNSVGDRTCRGAYREQLRTWLAARRERLCADCQRRAEENPLRVFDCKVEADRRLLAEAPTPVDHLCTPCADHLAAVRGALEASGVRYRLEPQLVRGLDYYQRTVFEVRSAHLGAQDALLGGGRYDGLVEELGGPPVAGFGFAMGLERTVMLLDEDRVPPPRADVALVLLGAEGLRAGTRLASRLRGAGLRVLAPLVERPLGAQLRRAGRARARYALFVGGTELAAGRFTVKDLDTGVQETLDERAAFARVGAGHVVGDG